MADVITTLHPEGAQEDNLYPNVRLENVVDSSNNQRIIGGDSTVATITGVTIRNAKWVLAGNILKMTAICDIDANASIPGNVVLFRINNLPSWIGEKIVPMVSAGIQSGYVDVKNFPLSKTGYNLASSNAQCYLYKITHSRYELYCWGTNADSEAQHFKIEFDFIIN